MFTSRDARLLSRIVSPSSGATSTMNSWRPTSSGVTGNSTATVGPEHAIVFCPIGIDRRRASAEPSSGRAVTVTSADAPSSPVCLSVTTTAARSDFFKSGGACRSTAMSMAAPGPTPTA